MTLDGRGTRDAGQALGDINNVINLLNTLPRQIGMTIIDGPHVMRYDPPSKPHEWGITGSVVIAESHITIHTFPEYEHVSLDVFSCKDFNWPMAETLIESAFNLVVVNTRLILRDLDVMLSSTPEEYKLGTHLANSRQGV